MRKAAFVRVQLYASQQLLAHRWFRDNLLESMLALGGTAPVLVSHFRARKRPTVEIVFCRHAVRDTRYGGEMVRRVHLEGLRGLWKRKMLVGVGSRALKLLYPAH